MFKIILTDATQKSNVKLSKKILLAFMSKPSNVSLSQIAAYDQQTKSMARFQTSQECKYVQIKTIN